MSLIGTKGSESIFSFEAGGGWLLAPAACAKFVTIWSKAVFKGPVESQCWCYSSEGGEGGKG